MSKPRHQNKIPPAKRKLSVLYQENFFALVFFQTILEKGQCFFIPISSNSTPLPRTASIMSMSYCLSVTTKEEEDGNGNLKHFCQLLTADLKRLAINLIYTAPPAKLIGIVRNVCFQFKPRKSAKSAVTLSLKLNKRTKNCLATAILKENFPYLRQWDPPIWRIKCK